MSDKLQNGRTPETEAPQPPIVVLAQYVKDVSLENPRLLEFLQNQGESPELQLNAQVDQKPLGPNTFEVTTTIRARVMQNNRPNLVAEVAYAGVFTLNGIPEDSIQLILLTECPRLLFPFIRSLMGILTQDTGYPPILLQPIDFAALYNQELATNQDTAMNASHVAN